MARVMPIAAEFIRAVVLACSLSHPVVREAPLHFDDEVVAHAEGESARNPFAVGVNLLGGLHETHPFTTASDAIAFTRDGLAAGRSLDVGLMQINLRAHPEVFASLDEAFNPQINTCAGTVILAQAHRAANCIYNTGRSDCRRASGTNGYPAIIAAAERRMHGVAPVRPVSIAAVANAGAPPSPAQAPDPSIPRWDVYGQARMALNSRR